MMGMDNGMSDNRRRTRPVEAAVNFYGERILEGKSAMKKPQLDSSEGPSSRTRELHLARRDIGRLSESRKVAETVRAQAESELVNAKKTVRDLTSKIEEFSSKAKSQTEDLQKLRKRDKNRNSEGRRYAEIMRELEYVKQELNKLKLDMAAVLEEKSRAEKASEAAASKTRSYSSSVEAIKMEIEEVNEEQVLVELARIEAAKELAAIEALRKAEASRFSAALDDARKKINEMVQEIESSRELEAKLAITTSDGNMLQSQLELVRETDKMVQRKQSLENAEFSSFQKGEEPESPLELKSVAEELEAAKKELASVKEEGFQFMTSMDIIRNELRHVMEEIARLKKTEDKTDLTVQNLNSKLLRAKAKLEAASLAEEKTKSLVSNLSLALEQLRSEAEAAKKERDLVTQETENIKMQIQKSESEIDLAEERLHAAMQELEAVKSSEAMALENLKSLVENSMRARASASLHSSKITISNLEYEYLTRRAIGAEEIADKKVAAARAWIEALKASETEIVMKTEIAQRKVRELRMEAENEACKTERSHAAKKMVEGELRNWEEQVEKNSEYGKGFPRKSVKENGNLTPARRARFQKSASPGIRAMTRSGSFTVKRRRKVMLNLSKLFRGKSTEKDC